MAVWCGSRRPNQAAVPQHHERRSDRDPGAESTRRRTWLCRKAYALDPAGRARARGRRSFPAVQLPTGLFPVVQFPRVLVSINAGTRPADQMVLLVTIPLEQAVRRVPGVLRLRSTTSRGSADISLDFAWGTDMVSAAVQIDAAIAQALPSLPAAPLTRPGGWTRRCSPSSPTR